MRLFHSEDCIYTQQLTVTKFRLTSFRIGTQATNDTLSIAIRSNRIPYREKLRSGLRPTLRFSLGIRLALRKIPPG